MATDNRAEKLRFAAKNPNSDVREEPTIHAPIRFQTDLPDGPYIIGKDGRPIPIRTSPDLTLHKPPAMPDLLLEMEGEQKGTIEGVHEQSPQPPAKVRNTQQCMETFCCYARKDQELMNQLKAHLMPLHRQGLITIWADTDINAGSEWKQEIEKHLNAAQIILLLVSSDFMNSDYCYSNEMKRALERHKQGEAYVIPVILRHVHWQGEPLGELQALPRDGKPVTDRYWHDLDEAFLNVVDGIRKAVELLRSRLQ